MFTNEPVVKFVVLMLRCAKFSPPIFAHLRLIESQLVPGLARTGSAVRWVCGQLTKWKWRLAGRNDGHDVKEQTLGCCVPGIIAN